MGDTVVIIGGNGKTGGRVAAGLAERGMAARFVSRSTLVPFDWENPESWAPALNGADRAYVTFQPDLAVEGADAAIDRLARLAREAGLKQMVLLSGRGEPGAQRAEAALQELGLPWNVVRASWFNQNFSEGYLLGSILSGELALPAGPVPEPFIDADDIADVAVAALTDPGRVGQLFEVTGPRSLTFAEAVDEIAQVSGRDIRFRQVSPQAFAELMQDHTPQEVIDLLLDLFTMVLDGRNSAPVPGVEQALGRPACDFTDYARRIAATGLWNG